MSAWLPLREELAALGKASAGPMQRRSALYDVFGRLAEAEDREELKLGEWEQRCLASALAYFRLGNLDAVFTQLNAVGKIHRGQLMALMPEMSQVCIRDLLREADPDSDVAAQASATGVQAGG
jgi:hypothetical protein